MPAKTWDDDELVEIKYPVALLDEHLMQLPPDPKTGEQKESIQLTEHHLRLIAHNNNERIRKTGDMAPVVIGHTIDGAPEKHQPELVGFAHKFTVDPLFNTGKKAIFARFLAFKKKLQKFKEFPRRSVELWLGKWEIDPISILGATTPDRDLGLIRLARSNDQSVTRIVEDDMDPNQIVEQVIAAIEELPWAKFCKELMEQAEAMEDQPGSESMGSPDGGPPPAEMPPEGGPPMEEGPPAEGEGGPPPEEEVTEEVEEEKPVQKAAACASGGNTFVPGEMGKKKMSRPRSDSDRLAEVEAANQVLTIKFARSERKAQLMELQAQHNIDLDLDDELNFVAPVDSTPLPESMYKAHLERIVKKYSRAPVNQALIVTRSGQGMNTKARVDAAVELATSKNISFAEAFKQVGE